MTAASGDEVEFYCDFCKTNISGNPKDLQIKLAWKLDCAARWNLYNIDYEPFAQNYITPPNSSVEISRYLSKRFFGGKQPKILKSDSFSMRIVRYSPGHSISGFRPTLSFIQ